MIADTVSSTASLERARSISPVSGATSTKPASRPAAVTASAVATNVLAGTSDAEPGGRSAASRASCNASVPLATPTAYSAPV